MRIEPHVELPAFGVLGRRRHGRATLPVHVPCMRAVYREELATVALQRCSASPPEPPLPRRWIEARFTIERFHRRAGLPVHRAAEIGQPFAARPIHFVAVQPLLAHHARVGTARDRHAAKVGDADRLGGSLQYWSRVEIARWQLLSGGRNADQCRCDDKTRKSGGHRIGPPDRSERVIHLGHQGAPRSGDLVLQDGTRGGPGATPVLVRLGAGPRCGDIIVPPRAMRHRSWQC